MGTVLKTVPSFVPSFVPYIYIYIQRDRYKGNGGNGKYKHTYKGFRVFQNSCYVCLSYKGMLRSQKTVPTVPDLDFKGK